MIHLYKVGLGVEEECTPFKIGKVNTKRNITKKLKCKSEIMTIIKSFYMGCSGCGSRLHTLWGGAKDKTNNIKLH